MLKLNWREIGEGSIIPILVIALWQGSVAPAWVNPQVLPSPLAVLPQWIAYLLPLEPYNQAAGDWVRGAVSGELIGDTLSRYRVLLGVAVGASLALSLGLMMGSSKRVYAWMNPLVQVVQPI